MWKSCATVPQVKKLNICNCSGGCIDSLSTPVPLAAVEVGGLAHLCRSCEVLQLWRRVSHTVGPPARISCKVWC
jgi:hypothetical protein